MRILITGATGLIGRNVCKELLRKSYKLVIVGQSSEEDFRKEFSFPCEYHSWDHLGEFNNIHGVVHLAGEPIASGRWTQSKKQRILKSRTETTKKLYENFKRSQSWPQVFVSASAVGFYGNRNDEWLTEKSSRGEGFLAEVCEAWENSSQPFESHSRVIRLRFGVVLSKEGGFLSPLEKLFSTGLGGVVGAGKQWLSWIHIQDLIKMISAAIENKNIKGVYNAVSPEPVTNKQWTKSFANQLKVKALLPAPTFAVKAVMGEMAQIALNSQRVSSEKIKQSGFRFQFETLNSALADIYSWKMRTQERLFVAEQFLPLKKETVFPFFSDCKNLETITPPWLNFKITGQSTEQAQEGTVIDYKLNLRGLPVRWRSQIKKWNPPHEFVDEQVKGPYKRWHHKHSFESYPQGTLLRDEVVYELPMGVLSQVTVAGIVESDVNKIFAYRKKVIQKLQKQWSVSE